MKPVLKFSELEFTRLEFYENFVISQLFEDSVLAQPQLNKLIEECSAFYNYKQYVYISHRINNYNVDPMIYFKLPQAKGLVGIAIVSDSTASLNMAQFEKRFAKLPFEVFLKLPNAIAWAEELVKK